MQTDLFIAQIVLNLISFPSIKGIVLTLFHFHRLNIDGAVGLVGVPSDTLEEFNISMPLLCKKLRRKSSLLIY